MRSQILEVGKKKKLAGCSIMYDIQKLLPA